MLYYATGALDAPGVVFTASHNPAAYNGIKMCLSHAAPIGEQTGLFEIRDIAIAVLDDGVDAQAWATTQPDESMQLLDQFADHVRSFVDLSNMRPLRVVADCANGMGGLVAPAVFAKMPVELDLLYPELDGTFPNHPADPLNSDNLKDLQARVLETGADVGLAFDGDADRVFLVDDKAQLVSGSLTTAMVAAGPSM
jgi:phosphomannomutase